MGDSDDGWIELGKMIKAARESMRPEVSVRSAARSIGKSEGWWRQLEAGGQRLKSGARVPPNPSNETLAAVCRVVGMDPDSAFITVGRSREEALKVEADEHAAQHRRWIATRLQEGWQLRDGEWTAPPGGATSTITGRLDRLEEGQGKLEELLTEVVRRLGDRGL